MSPVFFSFCMKVCVCVFSHHESEYVKVKGSFFPLHGCYRVISVGSFLVSLAFQMRPFSFHREPGLINPWHTCLLPQIKFASLTNELILLVVCNKCMIDKTWEWSFPSHPTPQSLFCLGCL